MITPQLPLELMQGDSTLLSAALDYARRGWSVIPVVGKQAATLWKPFKRRRPDERTLRKLFAREGVTGLAVILGSVSGGLAVRDFYDAGAYQLWAKDHTADAARLPTVKTARGYHVYGVLEREDYVAFPDGELRGDSRHYVVVPPSAHPDGPAYTWIVPLPPHGTRLPGLPSATAWQKTQAIPLHALTPRCLG